MPELSALALNTEMLGYGRMAVNQIRALRKLGVDVYNGMEDPTRSLDHLIATDEHKRTNTVILFSVPSHARGWWGGQHVVPLTMWEATKLPEALRENLHEFPQVIVPSRQNVELFSKYHPNVSYVPLGIDPEVWKFAPRSAPVNEFRFLIGGSGPRKGTDLAYKAFRKVFGRFSGDGPIPKLIFKSPKPEDFYGENIERIGGRISAEDEVALYESAHCYIQPSRGEGFGLQPLQAIAQGCPTILTDAHGHKAFSHLGIPIGYTMSDAGYFFYGDAGQWWEPSLDELCEQMEWVYDNYDHAVEAAAKNSREATEIFTWENSARAMIEVLGDELDKPYSGSGEWFTPSLKRYRLVTNRDYAADIAGVHYQWKQGTEYWESADCKRLLFEAGVLDPICLDDGEGLTDVQVAAMGEYSAAHEFCRMCGQKVNSGITRELEPA